MITRRNLLASLAAASAAAVPSFSAAQDTNFPSKPIRIIVATAPGALADHAARLFADRMSAVLKQPIVVENIAGGGSILAVRQLLRAAPDGYTLMHVSNTTVTAAHLHRNAGFALKDLAPIGEMVRSPSLMVVSSASQYKSLPELVAAAKKAPGSISYGSGGMGGTNHLPVELFARQAQIKLIHVPYKGIALVVPDVVANRVDFMSGTSSSTAELLRTGALRPVALTSAARSAAFPGVPTMDELGYSDGTYEIWLGLAARAGIPAAIMEKLNHAMSVARADTTLRERLEVAGQTVPRASDPQQFLAVMRAEDEKYGRLITEMNLKIE